MCGACGSGPAVPPWEVIAYGGTRRALAERAREAEPLSSPRLRVRPFGPAGYTSTSRKGRATVHPNLDSLLSTMIRECGETLPKTAQAAHPSAVARALLQEIPNRAATSACG